jgi:hypothetical protein
VVLFLHNTSHVADEPYPNLLREKDGSGFPTLVFLDSNGEVLSRPPSRSVDSFKETHALLISWVEAKAKVDAGDKTAVFDYLTTGIPLKRVNQFQAEQLRDSTPDLSKKQKQEIDDLIFSLEVDQIVTLEGRNLAVAGPKLLAMLEAGRVPVDGVALGFYDVLMNYAAQQGDRKLFVKCLKASKKRFGKNRRYRKYFKDREDQAKKVKKSR